MALREDFGRRPRVDPEMIGDKFGSWAGRDLDYWTLPGGAVLQFDLSQLKMADYRSMRDHYQINASLTVLTFILHQIDWHIECENQEIADQIENNLRERWTTLIRALSQAFWAGYAPTVINFENDPKSGYIVIDKFKDLVPEECRVNWKEVDGYKAPGQLPLKLLQYDGILHQPFGLNRSATLTQSSGKAIPIPPENSLWYPLMMENGDYYGRKLLKPAFPAWYFSQIIHLFANRYYERFGEPTPLGRANFEDDVDMGNGSTVTGKVAMENILSSLRSRSAVVLPSDRDPVTKEYDYTVEYLESQMRGADFERYMGRLDEEMSLAVFTPVLLFRTADVGSYNLGQAHLKIFLWMLNSVAGDLKYYIQHYIVNRLKDLNWGPKAPPAEWIYRKLGKDDANLYGSVVQTLISKGMAKPDLLELGDAIGLTLTEIEQVQAPLDDQGDQADGQGDPGASNPEGEEKEPDKSPEGPSSTKANYPHSLNGAREVVEAAVRRAYDLVSQGKPVNRFALTSSFHRALEASGADSSVAQAMTARFYGRVNALLPDLMVLADRPESYRDVLGNLADEVLEKV